MINRIYIISIFLFTLLISINSCKKENGANQTTQTEQQKVFQEFWDIYNRHYPLMHRKNINWQDVYDTYYPQITSNTSNDDLFNIFNTIMTTIIKDGHSFLEYNNKDASYRPQDSENIQNMIENNTPNKVNLESSSINNPYISYGTLVDNPNIGFILSKTFEPETSNEESEFNIYKSIVDEALLALQNKNGIIIDVRTNGGGQSFFAYYLAGRFLSQSSPIEILRNRYKVSNGSTVSSLSDWVLTAADNFDGYPDQRADGGTVASTYFEQNQISASGSFQFSNKVVVLTSRHSASASEQFIAAMKTQTNVKTIGNTSFGIFGGSERFTLLEGNGNWKTNISVQDTEVYYNGSFQSFEGIGITPDELKIPTESEVIAGKDTHIEAALIYFN